MQNNMEENKNAEPRKTRMIMVRATIKEAETIKTNAKNRNMTVSRYIRYRCLFDKI